MGTGTSCSRSGKQLNPAKHPNVRKALGQAFIDYLISPEGQRAIANYKVAMPPPMTPTMPTATMLVMKRMPSHPSVTQ